MDEQTKVSTNDGEVKTEVQISKETSLSDILDAVKELTKATVENTDLLKKMHMILKAGKF
jgi:hypothetical protein